MTGRHHVYIIKMGTKFRVRPGVASADTQQGNKTLLIRNFTDYRAEITFPGTGIGNVAVDAGQTLPVGIGNANRGFFEYTVTLKNTPAGDVPVEGESAPGLILDP